MKRTLNAGDFNCKYPENLTYNNEAKKVEVSVVDFNLNNEIDEITVSYYDNKGNLVEGDGPVNAGKYTIKISVKVESHDKINAVTDLKVGEFEIKKATLSDDDIKSLPNFPTGLTAKYGQTLKDVGLPSGWVWVDKNASVGEVGEESLFEARFTPDDTNNYEVARVSLKVSVGKAENGLKAPISIEGWNYGEAPKLPKAEPKFGSSEDIIFKYSSKEDDIYTAMVPTDAGTWYVKATMEGTDNYLEFTSEATRFKIKSIDNGTIILTKDHFSYTLQDSVYNGSEKTGVLNLEDNDLQLPSDTKSKILNSIIVVYYRNGEECSLINSGTYIVKIKVKDGCQLPEGITMKSDLLEICCVDITLPEISSKGLVTVSGRYEDSEGKIWVSESGKLTVKRKPGVDDKILLCDTEDGVVRKRNRIKSKWRSYFLYKASRYYLQSST